MGRAARSVSKLAVARPRRCTDRWCASRCADARLVSCGRRKEEAGVAELPCPLVPVMNTKSIHVEDGREDWVGTGGEDGSHHSHQSHPSQPETQTRNGQTSPAPRQTRGPNMGEVLGKPRSRDGDEIWRQSGAGVNSTAPLELHGRTTDSLTSWMKVQSALLFPNLSQTLTA